MKDSRELEFDAPLKLFLQWLGEAEGSEPNDATAAALATATPDGRPSVRMVLIKRIDEGGFSFFTNAESRKGCELAENPRAALCFHWKTLRRQVRVEGSVTELERGIVDAYFHSRSRRSQIAAAVSKQSRPLESREHLEEEVKRLEEANLREVPCPPLWRGFNVRAERIEFWLDGPDRLHDRFLFSLEDGGGWRKTRLYP